VNALWQVTIDADKFVFIEDGYTGAKVGTIDQPLEDIADWYLGDRDDATYLNKIIVLRGGNYDLTGDSNNNGNITIRANTAINNVSGTQITVGNSRAQFLGQILSCRKL